MMAKLILGTMLCTLFISCGKELPLFPEIGSYTIRDTLINGNTYKAISGIISDSIVLEAIDDYLLVGRCEISEAMNIQAGTKIYCQKGSALIVKRGGRLNVYGTIQSPVEFTSIKEKDGSASPGDWIGIHINGNAIINQRSSLLVNLIGKYGRLDEPNNEDNSGSIQYLRIKYAGAPLNGSTGALNINGVGSMSKLSFIQVYESSGSAIRLRGGTANIDHIVVTQPHGNGIVWDNGWSGHGQYLVGHFIRAASDTLTLCQGNSGGVDLLPRSNPKLSNITLIGQDSGSIKGIRITEGSLASVYNTIVTKTKRALRTDVSLEEIITETIMIKNNAFFNNEENYYESATAPTLQFTDGKYKNIETEIPLDGYIGHGIENSIDPRSIDQWFESANFVGGVKDKNNDWTQKWIKL